MKKMSTTCLLLLICLCAFATVQGRTTFSFSGSKVVLADSAAAAASNSQSDEYTRVLGLFDLQIRLGREGALSEKDYLALAASQTRNWTAAEAQQLEQAFASVDSFLSAHKISLKLPPEIMVVKSECGEELGAEGYTRGNRIMLHISGRQAIDVHLVAHELFHVYSRFQEKKRDELYAVFGFKRCNRIDVAKAMNGRVITNPDCPFLEHFITVDLEKPTDMTLLLYSKSGYKPGLGLGDYVNVGLLALDGKNRVKTPVVKGGRGVVYELDTVPDFFRQVSSNTGYVLHPEEIAAEHFAMLASGMQLQQPEFGARIIETLQAR